MPHILVIHEVEDYAHWRAGFDNHAGVRREFGCLGDHVFRDASNPNAITTLLEWDSFENAERFLEESGVKEAMQESGVLGPPTITFLNAS